MTFGFETKLFYIPGKSFPRINYLHSRTKSVVTRMQNILNYEFSRVSRGISKHSSDEVTMYNIKFLVERTYELRVVSLDETLIESLPFEDWNLTPEVPTPENEDIVACSVTVIVTWERDIQECLGHYSRKSFFGSAILAICVESDVNKTGEMEMTVKETFPTLNTKTQLVVQGFDRRLQSNDISNAHTDVSNSTEPVLRQDNSSVHHRNSQLNNARSSSFRSSKGNTNYRQCTSPKIQQNAVSSKGCASFQSFSRKDPLRSTTPAYSKIKPADSKSCKTSPTSNSESQKLKLSVRNNLEAGREKVQTTLKGAMNITSCIIPTKIKLQTDKLKQVISLSFETEVVDIIKKVSDLLYSVRDRRDKTVIVESETMLDKLIFEVEGLLAQSITEDGLKMKRDIEEQLVSQNLSADLLSVDGVYGCGTLFGRLCIHIETDRAEHIEKIREQINEVTRRHNYSKGFNIQTVFSKPQHLIGNVTFVT